MLVDEASGARHGPFEFRSGAKIELGGKTYVLTQLRQAVSGTSLEQRLKTVVIPKIDFRQANVVDVLDFLRDASVQFSPEDVPPEQRGVNMVLNLRGVAPASLPKITFAAKQLSLYEALKVVTQIADLRHRVAGSVIMIEPR